MERAASSPNGFFRGIIWPLTRLGLWCAALLGPILLILCIWDFAWGDWAHTRVGGVPVVFVGQKIAAVILALAVSGVGWCYVLRHRKLKAGEDKAGVYAVVVWLVIPLVLSMIGHHYQREYYQKVLSDMRTYVVTVSAVDAETGEPTRNLELAGPTVPRQYQEVQHGVQTVSFDGKMQIILMAAWPVSIEVGAKGYESKTVPLQPGIYDLVVRLDKKPASTAASRP